MQIPKSAEKLRDDRGSVIDFFQTRSAQPDHPDLTQRTRKIQKTVFPLVLTELRKRRAMVENPRCGALSFEPRWVIRSSEPPVVYQGEDTLRKHLPMIVFQNTSTPPLVRGDTAKYALDPNKVILAWVHDVKIFVPYFESCNVTSQSAYIRHYRNLAGEHFMTRKLPRIMALGPFEMIAYPDSLQFQLLSNVKKRLDRVYS
ncbi:hypothetical protein Y032_0006g2823 [Ancylostoma ceylanicum]|uniref:Glycosyltransferase family 92 protein n=1 Tax=Ancylostoma ceylanicum TaxID=53326 RepID=A0A016VPC8_9BILA|nr:hypothetical protein Y032_0006g2823 [Ancylostoma ceylanicum]